MIRARVLKSTGSWYELLTTDEQQKIKARASGRLRLNDKRLTNPISVGDFVGCELSGEDYLITRIEERSNYLLRASNKLSSKYQIIASNIDQILLMASLMKPFTPVGFIDRLLVSAESFRIPVVLVFNKKDLYGPTELDLYREMYDKYHSIVHTCMALSLMKEGAKNLLPLLEHKTTLITGNSGVGKSTLINGLIGQNVQRTAEVSNWHQKGGKHTTTFAEMIPLSKNTTLVDTPGIRDFGIADMDQAHIAHYFPEMRNLIGHCKFSNCLHLNEPNCAIKQAVAARQIHPDRYRVYVEMMQEIVS